MQLRTLALRITAVDCDAWRSTEPVTAADRKCLALNPPARECIPSRGAIPTGKFTVPKGFTRVFTGQNATMLTNQKYDTADLQEKDRAHIIHPWMDCATAKTRAPMVIADLEDKILELGPETVACFIAEPILASGGVIVPPKGYQRRTLEVCRKYDVLYISDEVVTGFGRLGHIFASEPEFGIMWDISDSQAP